MGISNTIWSVLDNARTNGAISEMVDHNQNLLLYVGAGLCALALLFIPIFNNPQSTHATDISNDLGYNLVALPDKDACTYLVFIINNVTTSQDCNTGQVTYTGNDSYTVIEKTIQLIPAGGLIHVKAGTYYISHVININKTSITIEGEGAGTSILHGVTKFKQGNGEKLPQMMLLSGTNIYNIGLRHFFIDGNAKNNTGVNTVGISSNNNEDSFFEDITVYNMTYRGIVWQNPHAGHFVNMYSEYNGATAYYIQGADTVTGVTGNLFSGLYSNNFGATESFVLDGNVHGNVFIGNVGQDDKGRCFYMFADFGRSPAFNAFTGNTCFQLSGHSGLYGFDLLGAQSNTFTGNLIYNMGQASSNTYDGFHLTSFGGFNSINNTFTGNSVISNGTTNHMRYGFNEQNSLQNFNTYVANNIAGMTTRGMNISGANSIVRDNEGFITENSGSATVTNPSTTVIVSHGLSYTPTLSQITIIPQATWGLCTNWWVSNPTSTQFTINCSASPAVSLAFSWKIERIP